MKDFHTEIRAFRDVEDFLNRTLLILDLPTTGLAQIMDAMLNKLHAVIEIGMTFTVEEARLAIFTQNANPMDKEKSFNWNKGGECESYGCKASIYNINEGEDKCEEELDLGNSVTIEVDDDDNDENTCTQEINIRKPEGVTAKPLLEDRDLQICVESAWDFALKKITSTSSISTPSSSCPTKKKRKCDSTPLPNDYSIYQLEERKLNVEEKRLAIECERIHFEEQGCKCEKEILAVLKELFPSRASNSVEGGEQQNTRHNSSHDSDSAYLPTEKIYPLYTNL